MKNYVRRTYIEFRLPGSYLSNNLIKLVKTRDISKVKVPKKAFCFSFFDIISTTVDVDGKKVELTSKRINETSMRSI